MKCARCHRQIDKPAGHYHGLPMGPTCLKTMFGFVPQPVKSVAVQVNEDQLDLFKGETK